MSELIYLQHTEKHSTERKIHVDSISSEKWHAPLTDGLRRNTQYRHLKSIV